MQIQTKPVMHAAFTSASPTKLGSKYSHVATALNNILSCNMNFLVKFNVEYPCQAVSFT